MDIINKFKTFFNNIEDNLNKDIIKKESILEKNKNIVGEYEGYLLEVGFYVFRRGGNYIEFKRYNIYILIAYDDNIEIWCNLHRETNKKYSNKLFHLDIENNKIINNGYWFSKDILELNKENFLEFIYNYVKE